VATEPARGIYRRYKGGLYLLLGTADDHANPERTLVVHWSVINDDPEASPMHVRDYNQFFGTVTTHYGDVPRFDYLGPRLTREMLSE